MVASGGGAFSPPDVVYTVRPGDANEPLRFSLRSLANLPHGTVWIVGHTPEWVRGVRSIPTRQGSKNKFENSHDNMRAAVAHPDVPEEFVYFNDDFFVMEPIGLVPVLYRGRLREMYAGMRARRRPARLPYIQAALETRDLLTSSGVEDPLSYELHVPMPMTKTGLADVLSSSVADGHMRTLYGNHRGVGGERIDDPKARSKRDPIPGGPFLSTAASSWVGLGGDTVRARFPSSCPYEVCNE